MQHEVCTPCRYLSSTHKKDIRWTKLNIEIHCNFKERIITTNLLPNCLCIHVYRPHKHFFFSRQVSLKTRLCSFRLSGTKIKATPSNLPEQLELYTPSSARKFKVRPINLPEQDLHTLSPCPTPGLMIRNCCMYVRQSVCFSILFCTFVRKL